MSTKSSPIAQNRRRGNRHRLSIPATLIHVGEPPIRVTVIEISVGGIGLQSETELVLERRYQLESFDTLIPPGMKVRVVSQRQTGEGSFEVGAESQ